MAPPRRPNGAIDRLRRHTRVEFVDDERKIGNGIIVTLKKGWTFDPGCDNRVRGSNTPSAALGEVRYYSHPFAGPYDP